MHDAELLQKTAEYKVAFAQDPKSFVRGVLEFCKQADVQLSGVPNGEYEVRPKKNLFMRILPWLAVLGGGYLALKGGEAWGRYANASKNPYGPIKGPTLKLLEKLHGGKFLYPGQPGYDETKDLRQLRQEQEWEAKYGPNSRLDMKSFWENNGVNPDAVAES